MTVPYPGDTSGPAFPVHGMVVPYGEVAAVIYPESGMTLRDHFAGLAMAELISTSALAPKEAIASWAYEYADAMLAERSKPKAPDAEGAG